GYEQKYIKGTPSFPHPVSLIGEQLGIKIHILDCTREFKNTVVKYFYNMYQNGQTPNPCMVCNPTIKFGTVLNHAYKLGASCLATGHYAKILKDNNNNLHLLRGTDTDKDQSYFLAFLTQQQLSSAEFPLGNMTKSKVRKLAHKIGLKPITSNESQDICFISDKNYKDFLSDQLDVVEKPGLIEDTNGRVIGNHTGLHKYTVGQRRGINCPSSKPYYVVKIDSKRNRLIVGGKDDLMCSEFKVCDINWIIEAPDNQISVKTRVRYRSSAYDTSVIPVDKKTALVKFKTPQSSVAPGQAAVFYKDNEVLGGGWILPNT
ncbi:MAG: tRNA 2-thiouridine(34) synthase MnmA, partial [Deltaproteobacteria bacterium]|nr:tRNA 2-thiouridine(34) synthase MnmA [Deltaproteobacteria bacterium]